MLSRFILTLLTAITVAKQAMSVTNSNSGEWCEGTVVVPDAAMRRRGPRGADLILASRDGDTVFHLLEVEKLRD